MNKYRKPTQNVRLATISQSLDLNHDENIAHNTNQRIERSGIDQDSTVDLCLQL